jgi:hypothetical protein
MNVDYESLQRWCEALHRVNEPQRMRDRKRSMEYWNRVGKARFLADTDRRTRKNERAKDRYHEIMADPERKRAYRDRQNAWRRTDHYRAHWAWYMRNVIRPKERAKLLNGEHTLWIMGGVVKVNMGRVA